jgi:hypothetical protein
MAIGHMVTQMDVFGLLGLVEELLECNHTGIYSLGYFFFLSAALRAARAMIAERISFCFASFL